MTKFESPQQEVAVDLARIAGIAAVSTILDVVCRSTGMGFAAIARVTEDRWICCAAKDTIGFGLGPGDELDVRTTLCDEIRGHRQGVVIDHVAEDDLFRDHPTPRMYGLESYISLPIILPGGQFFGTLCAIDPRPAKLKTPEVIGMFSMFAELIAFHLDAQDRLAESRAALLDARQSAQLREQFIAVLGHDLRNPLAAIDAGARMMRKTVLEPKANTVLDLMQNSVLRMTGLIANVMDFARGRLGGGLTIDSQPIPDLDKTLRHVIAELSLAWPDRAVEIDMDLARPVRGDGARIGQLFSNLLSNALTHGAPDQPVRVRVVSGEDRLELSVANGGEPIPPGARQRLFQPFARGSDRFGQQGLGLGLYIASEIAQAHGGQLDMVSDAEETRFTFRMPQPADPDGANLATRAEKARTGA